MEAFLKRIEVFTTKQNPANPRKKWGHRGHKLIFETEEEGVVKELHTYIDKFNRNYNEWETVMLDLNQNRDCWIYCEGLKYYNRKTGLLDADYAPTRTRIYDTDTGMIRKSLQSGESNFNNLFDPEDPNV